MKNKLIRAVKDIENWKGDAYQSGDDIDQALDDIKSVIADMEKSKTISGKIVDSNDGYKTEKEIDVRMGRLGVYIGAKNYSTKTGEEDEIIMIEQSEGKLRLIVWGDINEEDPTHIINLNGARESRREKE